MCLFLLHKPKGYIYIYIRGREKKTISSPRSFLVSVQLGHFLVCLLVFLFLVIFVACWTTLFWASHLGLLLLFSFCARYVKQGCLSCISLFKVKKYLNYFWDPLLVFCPKNFLFISLFFSY